MGIRGSKILQLTCNCRYGHLMNSSFSTLFFTYYKITGLLSWRQLGNSAKLIPLIHSCSSLFHHQFYNSKADCLCLELRQERFPFVLSTSTFTDLPPASPGWYLGQTTSRTPSCYVVLTSLIASQPFSSLHYCFPLYFYLRFTSFGYVSPT